MPRNDTDPPANEPAIDACPFCQYRHPGINRIMVEGKETYVRWDNFPAAEGHVEIVPKRHVESYFDLTPGENTEIRDLLRHARNVLEDRFRPDGYTIGVNEGRAAGRTIDHLHIHMIPRYHGDVPDPRGGIRHVLPGTDPDAWTP